MICGCAWLSCSAVSVAPVRACVCLADVCSYVCMHVRVCGCMLVWAGFD